MLLVETMSMDIPTPAAEVPVAEPRTGLVYRLKIGDYYYIGSTLCSLTERMNKHRATYTGGKRQRKLHGKIEELGGWEKLVSEVLEENVPENTLRAREASYTDVKDPYCLNSVRPVMPLAPPLQRKLKTEPKQLERVKAYYHQNKEALKERRRERWQRDKQDPEKMARIRQQVAEAQARYIAKLKSQAQS
jgi:hypothetical protein